MNNIFSPDFKNGRGSSNNDNSFLSATLNTNKSHPLIPNSQEYIGYKKYISIHSEDRDILKYPNASLFEIELPEDYLNVYTVRLASWAFPSNYDLFSPINANVTLTFQINNPYNPGENMYTNPLQNAIFEALYSNLNNNFVIVISQGFFTPIQMTTELTNRFNAAVTTFILNYFTEKNYTTLADEFLQLGGYSEFSIVYNSVDQRIWFGNSSSGFILTNSSNEITEPLSQNFNCFKYQLPEFVNWGLPSFLGLPRCNVESTSVPNVVPRFFFGSVNPGDNGYWVTPNPNLPGSQVSTVTCPSKINLMGASYLYMEIDGLNCIDETSPYNVSRFTTQTNETNGIVNSSFAKIPIPATPLCEYFDNSQLPYKYFLPPAERIRKLKIKIRYHNGQLANFDNFNFTFLLEFTLLTPQQQRKYTIVNPLSS